MGSMLSGARSWAPYAVVAIALHAGVFFATVREAPARPEPAPIHVTLREPPARPIPPTPPLPPKPVPPPPPRIAAVPPPPVTLAPPPPAAPQQTTPPHPPTRPVRRGAPGTRAASIDPNRPAPAEPGPPTPGAAPADVPAPPTEPAPDGPPPTPPADDSGDGRFDVAGYGRALSMAVHARKSYPRAAERRGIEGTVRIHVVVSRDGRLADAPSVQQTSGDEELDAQAVRMVEAAAPFEALPDTYRKPTIEFVIPIDFTLRR